MKFSPVNPEFSVTARTFISALYHLFSCFKYKSFKTVRVMYKMRKRTGCQQYVKQPTQDVMLATELAKALNP